MGITIVQKSDLSKKKVNAKVALVLAGGAITGGTFKVGGLKALNDFLVNRKVTDFDIYVGISAGGTGGALTQNTAKGNTGFGFDITSGGHSLLKNVSGGTGSGEPNGPALSPCQYNVAGSNANLGENDSNGVTVGPDPFPTGCTN